MLQIVPEAKRLQPDFDQSVFSIQTLNGEFIFVKDGCRRFIFLAAFFFAAFFLAAFFPRRVFFLAATFLSFSGFFP
jgi:hypothetical protein